MHPHDSCPIRRTLALLALLLAATACASDPAAELRQEDADRSVRPPNFVVVYVDDWGWRDAGFQGSAFYETPRMDAFAAEGMVFTDAYAAAPNCAPSRASLLTGRYTPRHGILTVGSSKRGRAANRALVPIENQTVLADEELTIAELLREAGYRTAHFGKWHLGDDARTQGFDVNAGGFRAGHPKSYFSPYRNPMLEDGPEGEYLTDRLTDEVVGFLGDSGDRPFFAYVSHYAVHTPVQAKPDDAVRFADKPADGEQANGDYAGMVLSVDRSLGRILDVLDELDLAEDTVVLLTSDNGGHGVVTSNAPLRGMKGMLYEGGIRVPFVVRWPGRIAAGARSGVPVHGVDLLPTLADLAGVPLAPAHAVDGVSLAPALGGGELERDALYWHFPAYLEGNRKTAGSWRTTPVGALRAGRWKLLEWFETGARELYDLAADPGETSDLAGAEPELVEELGARLAAWREEVGARVPTEPEPAYDPGR